MLHPPLNWAALSMICAWTVVGVCEEDTTSAPKTPSAAPEQAFAVCELYAPGHFGNSYEVLGDNEIRSVLSEAKFWGFGRYGDWFDTDDCKDPFAPGTPMVWAVQEQLQRGLWGLPPLRHIFGRRYTPLPWYRSWANHQVTAAAHVSGGQ